MTPDEAEALERVGRRRTVAALLDLHQRHLEEFTDTFKQSRRSTHAHPPASAKPSTRPPGGRVAKLSNPAPSACYGVYTEGSEPPRTVYTEGGAQE